MQYVTFLFILIQYLGYIWIGSLTPSMPQVKLNKNGKCKNKDELVLNIVFLFTGKAYPPEFYYDTYSPLWQNRPTVYGFKLQWTQMNPNTVDRIVAYRLGIRQVGVCVRVHPNSNPGRRKALHMTEKEHDRGNIRITSQGHRLSVGTPSPYSMHCLLVIVLLGQLHRPSGERAPCGERSGSHWSCLPADEGFR